MGAPGTFRCAGDAAGGTCTVDISGPNDYVFASVTNVEWQFIPTSATSQVIIPDAEYMWFGWWKREPFETTPNAVNAVFDYAANYGGTNAVTNVTGATASATYEGAAIGYYGVYDIEAAEDDRSRAGRFQAKATLIADFDAVGEGTLSGSITEFDTEPTWAVTLKSQAISSGAVAAAADTVSWTISGLPRDGGQWEAAVLFELRGSSRRPRNPPESPEHSPRSTEPIARWSAPSERNATSVHSRPSSGNGRRHAGASDAAHRSFPLAVSSARTPAPHSGFCRSRPAFRALRGFVARGRPALQRSAAPFPAERAGLNRFPHARAGNSALTMPWRKSRPHRTATARTTPTSPCPPPPGGRRGTQVERARASRSGPPPGGSEGERRLRPRIHPFHGPRRRRDDVALLPNLPLLPAGEERVG